MGLRSDQSLDGKDGDDDLQTDKNVNEGKSFERRVCLTPFHMPVSIFIQQDKQLNSFKTFGSGHCRSVQMQHFGQCS